MYFLYTEDLSNNYLINRASLGFWRGWHLHIPRGLGPAAAASSHAAADSAVPAAAAAVGSHDAAAAADPVGDQGALLFGPCDALKRRDAGGAVKG